MTMRKSFSISFVFSFFLCATVILADYIDYVDTRISSGGLGWGVGGQNPGPQVPFGSLRLGPDGSHDEIYSEFDHLGGYHYNDTTIRCFSHTHLVGAGVADYGNFGVMAVTHINETVILNHNYRSFFNHSQETAKPGYYSVYLETPRVKAELTAGGTHAGYHRYTFDGRNESGQRALVLIDICHSTMTTNEGACAIANVTVDTANNVMTGAILMKGSLTGRSPNGGVWVFFTAQFEGAKAITHGMWSNHTLVAPGTTQIQTTSGSLGAWFDFGAISNASRTIGIRVGLSWLNISMSTMNLQSQIATTETFDTVRSRTQALWNKQLSIIDAKSSVATLDDFGVFYTGLYHTMTAPSTFSESKGVYLGFDNKVHVWPFADGEYYTDMSLWDTHRSANPLLALIQPIVSRDVVRSLIQSAKDGGDIPRWPLANVYTGCMCGNHGWITIVDNWVKGIQDYDVQFAYQLMVLEATTPRPHNGRADLNNYLTLGYVTKDNDNTAASLTLDYAFDDWAISTLAKSLGYTDDYNTFFNRSKNYKNIWVSDVQFMCSRYSNGTYWCPPEPETYLPYPWKSGYVEGNAWQYWMFVPGDPEGLVSLFPSQEAFAEKLNYFFNESLIWPGDVFPNPYYWAGNEPDILAAWLFNFGGRPDLTQKWTREMLKRHFHNEANGLPGNDDYGTMSAWAVFANLGFYPLSASTRYSLGSPLFESIYINRQSFGLSDISILAHGASPTNIYIQNGTINGLPLKSGVIDHTDFNKAPVSVLELWMGSQPSTFLS